MPFELTQHAREMLYERQIPFPKMKSMKNLSKQIKNKIKQSCHRKGYNDKKYTYFCSGLVKINVYVCIKTSRDNYLVITAFKYDL